MSEIFEKRNGLKRKTGLYTAGSRPNVQTPFARCEVSLSGCVKKLCHCVSTYRASYRCPKSVTVDLFCNGEL